MSGAVGPLELQSNKGAENGYASLDDTANVPADQLANVPLITPDGIGAATAVALNAEIERAEAGEATAQTTAETFATTAVANARFTYASSYWR